MSFSAKFVFSCPACLLKAATVNKLPMNGRLRNSMNKRRKESVALIGSGD